MHRNKHSHSGREPPWLPVAFEKEGETYKGVSQVKDSEIMVRFMGQEEHTLMSGPLASHPEAFARLLLGEMVGKYPVHRH